MIAPIDPLELPLPAQKILGEGANPKLRQMAAKGIVPGLRPDALVSVLVFLSSSLEADVGQTARATLAALPPPVLTGALSADLPAAAIDVLARQYNGRPEVLQHLLRMPRLHLETIEHLAQHGDEPTTELLSVNEERMLSHPKLIEMLYMNKATRMSTADRLIELAVRNKVELGLPAFKEMAIAIQSELIPDRSEDPLPEDEVYKETQELAERLHDESVEDAFFEAPDGNEHIDDRFKPLYMRLADMTVSQKIRRAMLGTKEERMVLIRESNKVVAAAAARSPLMQESEVALISRNRGVSEDVLRIIGNTPEWLKSYQVKKNLVENAKTPQMIAIRLISQLREADLKKLAQSKNISSAVQMAARRHLQRRD